MGEPPSGDAQAPRNQDLPRFTPERHREVYNGLVRFANASGVPVRASGDVGRGPGRAGDPPALRAAEMKEILRVVCWPIMDRLAHPGPGDYPMRVGPAQLRVSRPRGGRGAAVLRLTSLPGQIIMAAAEALTAVHVLSCRRPGCGRYAVGDRARRRWCSDACGAAVRHQHRKQRAERYARSLLASPAKREVHHRLRKRARVRRAQRRKAGTAPVTARWMRRQG